MKSSKYFTYKKRITYASNGKFKYQKFAREKEVEEEEKEEKREYIVIVSVELLYL